MVDNDPNVGLRFSMTANLSARAIIRVRGTGNPMDPIYRLLFSDPLYFPDPNINFIDIPFEVSSLTAEVEGTASIGPNGDFQSISLSVVPSGTYPWELSEVEQFIGPALTTIKLWIDGIVAQLATAQTTLPGTPGTFGDEVCAVLSAIPIVGPSLCQALTVAAPIMGAILWEGRCDPNECDCSAMIDIENTQFNFQTITCYGLRNIALSYATTMLQKQINGLLTSLDFTEFLTMIPVNQSSGNFSLVLGPKRMNAAYPTNAYHVLGGMIDIGFSMVIGDTSCMAGGPQSIAPSIPSDYLCNPEPFFPNWGVFVPDWDVCINIHQGLFQDLLNQATDTGVFYIDTNGSILGVDFALEVSETSYPKFVLTSIPYAIDLSSNDTFPVGSILFEQGSGPGLTINLTLNGSIPVTAEMDLSADLEVTFTNEALDFRFTDFQESNLTITRVDQNTQPLFYAVVNQAIDQLLSTLNISNQTLGIDGIPLPFSGYCLELAGYGAWEYCDIPDRAMGIMVRFDANCCP